MNNLIKGIVVLIILVVSSYYLINLNEELKGKTKVNYVVTKEPEKTNFDKNDEYILSVLACEMPASYNEEALKAQAVAARTFALYRIRVENAKKLTKNDQCFIDEDGMKEKWQDSFDKYYNKLKNVVIETKNQIMFKGNVPIKSFYFSLSNGYTESSKTVFNANFSDSVTSLWDKEAKDYLKTVEFTNNDLISKLGDFKNIKIVKRNSTNHVEKIKVDNKEMSGIEFRKLLKLRSTDFEIEVKNDKYIITTKGYGHCVGMSQYGANYLAKSGKNYQEILNYYYGDVDIQKINV